MKKMVHQLLSTMIIFTLLVLSTWEAKAQETPNTLINKYEVINKHNQIYANSCIPSSIEIVLKFNKKVDADFYNYQRIWENKIDGTFANFDGLLLNGVRFHHQFNVQRNKSFPFDDLFAAIDKEIVEGKYVIVSLPSGFGWHMYVITDKLSNGEFVAYSKNRTENLIETNVKQIIRSVNGTDIMTYRVE